MTDKTLKLTVYLWTDELPEGADCWDHGQVYLLANRRKAKGKGTMFNSPEELGAALMKELRVAGLAVARKARSKR